MGDARDGATALVKGGVHVQSIEPRFRRVGMVRVTVSGWDRAPKFAHFDLGTS